jgi:hypothetical protein
MRKLILAAVAAAIAGAPLATVVKAEGTTTMHKSDTMGGQHKTMKKYQNRYVAPREGNKKMMMHHEQNY